MPSETPRPREHLTAAQSETMKYVLGESGFKEWDRGLLPTEFQTPPQISTRLRTLRSRSLAENREYGMQFWWEYGNAQMVAGHEYHGEEGETQTQNFTRELILSERATPIVDIHTHPKQFSRDEPNNYARAQFPSDEDLSILAETPHMVGMFIAAHSGYSCVVKTPSTLLGTAEIPDLEALSAQEFSNNAKIQHTGVRIHRALGGAYGVYHTLSPQSDIFQLMRANPRHRRSYVAKAP